MGSSMSHGPSLASLREGLVERKLQSGNPSPLRGEGWVRGRKVI
jgi:hypothetical protein